MPHRVKIDGMKREQLQPHHKEKIEEVKKGKSKIIINVT